MDQIEEKKTNKRKKKKGLSASAWLAQARRCREPTHPCLFFSYKANDLLSTS
jgi:hypothetical protein